MAAGNHVSGDGLPTTYSAVSHVAEAVDLLAGLALLAAAFAASVEGVTALAALALATAATWFAPDAEGWTGGPSLVRSLAAMLVPLLAPALCLLALASPRGLIRPRSLRIVAVLLAAVAVCRGLVRDPLLDPNCWRDCYDHAFLLSARPGLASALGQTLLGAGAAIGALVVVVAARRLATATPAARRLLGPVLVTGALAGAAEAVHLVTLLVAPVEDPRRTLLLDLFYVRASLVAAFGLALAATLTSLARRRRWIARFATALGDTPAPGRLRDTLAGLFGDPGLEVTYWLPAARRYVDAEGRPVATPAAVEGRAVTQIVRSGTPVAAVVHDPALVDASFERELGSAARLAVENERLQAEVRAQLEALRGSRTRITARADAERQRLERDLHDGAQQRLLALSFDLRLARSAAESAADALTASRLAAAVDEAAAALEELRELAHGIFPAILAEAGLGAALETLADESALPVELSAPAGARLPAAAEAALYAAVREAIEDAGARGATFVRVALTRDGQAAALVVDDDGRERDVPLVHVEDRVGALGGRVMFGPSSYRAEIPCA